MSGRPVYPPPIVQQQHKKHAIGDGEQRPSDANPRASAHEAGHAKNSNNCQKYNTAQHQQVAQSFGPVAHHFTLGHTQPVRDPSCDRHHTRADSVSHRRFNQLNRGQKRDLSQRRRQIDCNPQARIGQRDPELFRLAKCRHSDEKNGSYPKYQHAEQKRVHSLKQATEKHKLDGFQNHKCGRPENTGQRPVQTDFRAFSAADMVPSSR